MLPAPAAPRRPVASDAAPRRTTRVRAAASGGAARDTAPGATGRGRMRFGGRGERKHGGIYERFEFEFERSRSGSVGDARRRFHGRGFLRSRRPDDRVSVGVAAGDRDDVLEALHFHRGAAARGRFGTEFRARRGAEAEVSRTCFLPTPGPCRCPTGPSRLRSPRPRPPRAPLPLRRGRRCSRVSRDPGTRCPKS